MEQNVSVTEDLQMLEMMFVKNKLFQYNLKLLWLKKHHNVLFRSVKIVMIIIKYVTNAQQAIT